MLDAAYVNRILSKKRMPGVIPDSGKPRLLDLCCGAGGATKGYQRAGFYVVGLDIRLQPHYCGNEFIKAPVLKWLSDNLAYVIENFDGIHASPPCQAFSKGRASNDHPNLITPLRPLLLATGLPYVLENVKFAPLHNPITLCGSMFGLTTYRDRWFETNFPVAQPPHPRHINPVAGMGMPPDGDEFMHVVGNFSDVKAGQWAMGINWMTRNELREAIPPAYTGYIATYLLKRLALC